MLSSGNSITAWGGGSDVSVRDGQVIELVGRFRLVSGEQIRKIFFSEQRSKTPLDRTLKRLTERAYLARLGGHVGGFRGGQTPYVYQLGRVGWRYLGKGGGYRPLRVVDYHTLTITECFVVLKQLERVGEFSVLTCDADPASRRTVGDILLTPDAFVDLGIAALKLKFSFWLEIDRDTENAEVIRGKCIRYWRVFQSWDGDVFPYVVFVAPDVSRRRELQRIIAGGPEEAQALFKVYELDTFGGEIMRAMRE